MSTTSESRLLIAAIEGEYRRYKALAENAMGQIDDAQFQSRPLPGNSVAIVVQHIAGNLKSRFTDFLTSDGEKPWRDRESEFADPGPRKELMRSWEEGWERLFEALTGLSDEQLNASVSIRGVSLSVAEALMRSLSHTSHHVGQIVLLAKGIRGSEWRYLSIPPGKSVSYNADPKHEKPPGR